MKNKNEKIDKRKKKEGPMGYSQRWPKKMIFTAPEKKKKNKKKGKKKGKNNDRK